MGKGCIEAIYGLMGWKGLKSEFIENCLCVRPVLYLKVSVMYPRLRHTGRASTPHLTTEAELGSLLLVSPNHVL